ncbi:MAG: hypothetical protein ABR921_06240 [Candidatus Sulfotelmatobacter sp.]
MPFFYQSGEQIEKGDRVTYHGEPGEIDFVADKIVGDSAFDWYVTEQGGGVMIIEPKVFGRVFVHDTENDEDLILIARQKST